MTPKSDKHNNYDVHNTLQCQILHQSGLLYMPLFLQWSILFALRIDRFICLENLKLLVKVIPKQHSSAASWIGASGASV